LTTAFHRRVTSALEPGLPPWGPHVRFRRVQTLVREGSPLVKLRNSALGSRSICATKRSSSPSDAKAKAMGWLVCSRSTPRPPNLRQNAVLDRQTVHVSLAVAITLHRRAAM